MTIYINGFRGEQLDVVILMRGGGKISGLQGGSGPSDLKFVTLWWAGRFMSTRVTILWLWYLPREGTTVLMKIPIPRFCGGGTGRVRVQPCL